MTHSTVPLTDKTAPHSLLPVFAYAPSNRKTAKNFVAAANFLELLKVFGDIDSEVEEKIKYAKWRAADIVKAIRDGRQPAPPPGANTNNSNDNQLNQDFMDTTSLSGFDTAAAGAASTNALSPPSAAATFSSPMQPPQQPAGGPAFPTISNFPSPPLGHTASNFNNNDNTNNYNNNTGFNGSIGGGGISNNNNWNQSGVSPNLNQGQIPYSNNNPAGSPSVHHQQQPQQPQQPQFPPSNYNNIQPTLPVSPTPPASQYPPYQPPAPAPAPAPVSNPYTPQPQQPIGGGYNSPSAPYQQPTAHSPYVPAAPAMVLDPAVSTQIQKHCKWTVSALTYDDIPTAIDNLEKALALLRVS